MDGLSDKAKIAGFDTFRHIETVRNIISVVVVQLLERARLHDQSKLENPEAETFAEYTAKLAGTTYGSEEYKKFLAEMKPALDHHYANNRHHPEHFADGIEGMDLIDLVEMLCDWRAATLRHNDGNMMRSIEINTARFGIDPQLRKILENTANALFY